MDHSTPFKLVPEPPREPSGNFVVFEQLPEASLCELSLWMDVALETLEEENAQFATPSSTRKHLISGR